MIALSLNRTFGCPRRLCSLDERNRPLLASIVFVFLASGSLSRLLLQRAALVRSCEIARLADNNEGRPIGSERQCGNTWKCTSTLIAREGRRNYYARRGLSAGVATAYLLVLFGNERGRGEGNYRGINFQGISSDFPRETEKGLGEGEGGWRGRRHIGGKRNVSTRAWHYYIYD
jgi:hypothetical protein